MTIEVAPFGHWESPITVDSVASKQREISSPRVCNRSGRAFFAESRESGGTTIVEITEDGIRTILPPEYSAQNTVYEYGGSLYDVLPDGNIIFSNEDNGVKILNPDTREVAQLISQPNLRYSSFNAHVESSWVLAIEEDHTHDVPRLVRNYVVAINFRTAEVKRVLQGADFYYSPLFSMDGTQVTWLEWNHPGLPFDAAKVYCAEWNSGNASIGNYRFIAGHARQDVAEPRWGYDGSLFFAQRAKGYRQLFRVRPGSNKPVQIVLKGQEDADFGKISLFEGSRSYALLSDKHLFAAATVKGVCRLIVVDLDTCNWWDAPNTGGTICEVSRDAVTRLNASSALVVGKGVSTPQQLYRIDIHRPESFNVIRKAAEARGLVALYAKPEPLCISSTGNPPRKIYGFLWMPHNPKFAAPKGTLPPLIISIHGGPTSISGCGLSLATQYFTSRGYAYVLLNYTGSTGYGTDYRYDLFGNWGVVDADDVAECSRHLISTGRISPGAVGITGHSAGGYATLQCLTRHPNDFAGAICVAGVSDLNGLEKTTHKLESYYLRVLALKEGATEEDKARTYRERSAIYHTEKIKTPLLLLHGSDDTVVPLEQARIIADALEGKTRVELIEVQNEGHMMDKPSSKQVWVEAEEKWWRKTLLGTQD